MTRKGKRMLTMTAPRKPPFPHVIARSEATKQSLVLRGPKREIATGLQSKPLAMTRPLGTKKRDCHRPLPWPSQ